MYSTYTVAAAVCVQIYISSVFRSMLEMKVHKNKSYFFSMYVHLDATVLSSVNLFSTLTQHLLSYKNKSQLPSDTLFLHQTAQRGEMSSSDEAPERFCDCRRT